VPSVPRDLETICLKCLRKRPQRRYGSAAELAEDLRRFQAGEPIRARRTTAWERAVKWGRRRPAVAGLAALGVVVTAPGFGLVTWQWSRAVLALEREQAARVEQATAQVNALLTAHPRAVPDLLAGLEPFRAAVLPRLRQVWEEPDRPDTRPRRMRAALALL